MKTETCKDKVENAFEDRMSDIRHLWHILGNEDETLYCELCKEYFDEGNVFEEGDINKKCPNCDNVLLDIDNDIGSDIYEYGLCIDLVKAGTFPDQRANYIRYQISYGGPSEEFRVYENGDIEFWYLDWFDGASCSVKGNDAEIIREIIEMSGVDFT